MKVFIICLLILIVMTMVTDFIQVCKLLKNKSENYEDVENNLFLQFSIKAMFLILFVVMVKIL